LLNALKKNIAETIGESYELIVIDNSVNQFSITEAYNSGIDKARFEYLLFLHEDVYFHTLNWGCKLIGYFSALPDLGLIGVAGATFKSKAPSLWTDAPMKNWVLYLKQRLSDGSVQLNTSEWASGNSFVDVKVIDGVFMATRKSLNFRFDQNLKGFHFYDTYLSIIVSTARLRIIVTNDILLEHFSTGKQNEEWVKSADLFHRNYSQYLPLGTLPKKQQEEVEFQNLVKFVELCITYEKKWLALIYWIKLLFCKSSAKKKLILLKNIL
jgi:hypothetical protein